MKLEDILTDKQYKVVKLPRGVHTTEEAFRSWAIKQKLRMTIRQPWKMSAYDDAMKKIPRNPMPSGVGVSITGAL